MRKILFAATCGFVMVLVNGVSIAQGQDRGQEISYGNVKIAVLSDMSGIYQDIGGIGNVVAAQMAIEDFGGTVLGKPIKLISADHQSRADIASTLAREMMDQQHADVFVSTGDSSTALAVQAVASAKDTITMAMSAGTTALTGEQCTKYGIQYVYNVGALSVGTANAIVEIGGDTWFFIIADYAFGHSLLKNAKRVIEELGGEVVGSAAAPLGTSDFASYLIQAKVSGAEVVALGNAGSDFINSVKQASAFGIAKGGQQLVAMILFLNDAKGLGVDTAQGMRYTTAFYWDRTDKSREWSKRFFEIHGAMPTMAQAGTYSGVLAYLNAVEKAGTDDSNAVRKALSNMTINDMFVSGGHIRPNGSMVHDMYLMQIKTPEESEGPWDLAKMIEKIPAEDAFIPLSKSSCPLLNK